MKTLYSSKVSKKDHNMNTQNINSRIKELETKIEQAQNRKLHADTRQQQANDQRDIDSLRAKINWLTEKLQELGE